MSNLARTTRISFFLALAVLMFAFAGNVNSQVNQEINYQGKLTDGAGAAVADGTYNMRFWLLTSDSIATTSAEWTEELTGADRVQVTNGLFSVMLGSTTALTGVDFNQNLYLGVEIGGVGGTASWDGEMSPRKILGTVPSAFEAQKVGGVASSSFLRSDQADTATALLAFTGGFTSSASSTVYDLYTGTTTVTTLDIGGEKYTAISGGVSGLTNSGGTLTANISESNLNINAPTDDYILRASSTATGGFEWVASTSVGIHDALTLTGSYDYLTLSGQEITLTELNIVDDTDLGITATGLEFSGSNIALNASYNIPLTSSTTEWATAYGWGDHGVANYQSSSLTSGYVFRGGAGNTAEATSTLFIADNTYVGIGTTSPSRKFTVAGDTYVGAALRATGTVQFDALSNGGFLTTNGSGVLSTSTIGVADLTAEDFGSFSVSGGTATIDTDAVTTDMIASGSQVDEYCLTYESGDTWEWQDCSGGNINLINLNDVNTTGVNVSDIIAWNGSNWVDVSTSTFLMESELNTEADLYGLLSDVSEFWENGDTLSAGAISSGFGNIDNGSSNLTSGGTITFAGLSNGGFLTTNGSGVLSTSTIGVADLTAEDFGSFSVSGGAATIDNNSITPDMASSTGQVDEYCLTYESTNDTWEWQDCAGGSINLGDLSNVDDTNAANGTLLSYNGSSWATTSTSSLNINTDDLTEGSNQFFTNARARSAISETITGITYTSGTGVFSLDGSYNIPLTASTTNWNNFFDTPSSVITDGTGLTWTGNTLALTNDFGASIDESELNINAPTDDYILVASTTATGGFEWVATSTARLGLGGGSSVSFGTDNQIPVMNAGGTDFEYSDNFTLTSSNLNLGVDFGLAIDGNRILHSSSTNQSISLGQQAGENLLSAGNKNVFIGYQAGRVSTTTDNATFVGYESGELNTTGNHNSFFGYRSGLVNTTGNYGTFIGAFAGDDNLTGNDNVFVGRYSGSANTIGNRNTYLGNSSGAQNIDASDNTFVGYYAGEKLTSGGDNTFFGSEAGRYLTNGSTGATGLSDSVFLGVQTEALTVSDTNSIVIGFQAEGLGSNTVVLGNDSILTTALKGNVGIGTTSPASKLDVWGSFNVATTGIANAFTVDNDGEVGIGLADPAYLLDLYSAGSNSYMAQFVSAQGEDVLFVSHRDDDAAPSSGTDLVLARSDTQGNLTAAGTKLGGLRFSGEYNGYRTGAEIIATTDGTTYSGTSMPTRLEFNVAGDGEVAHQTDAELVIKSSGNIGIGTSSPASKLDVWGDFRVGTSSAPLIFADVSSGLIGIGNNNPSYTVDITGNIRASGNFRTSQFIDSDNSSYFINPSSGSVAGTFNGNVGIGSSSPARLLSVGGDAIITGALYDNNNSAGTYGMILMSTSTGFEWVATSSSNLGFGTVTSVDMSVPTGLAISGNPITTSGTLALTYDTGYAAVLTASTTNWNNFYDTPSTVITDGTGLTWTGNTLALTNDFGADIGVSELTDEDFGSFTVSGGTATIDNNAITPDMASSTGQVDEYCLTYEATGDTWQWQDCAGGSINLGDLANVDDTNAAAGTLLSYNGGSWATTSTSSLNINTDNLVEGSNLFFTNARARSAISETITGLTYTSATGIWTLDGTYNIPLTASTTEWATAYGWGDHSLASYLTDITGENIESLSNVDTTGLATSNILSYNGSNWVDTSTSTFLMESELSTEAELYTLLSDVSEFWENGDTLSAGAISSGFGNIDNGSSNLTSGGTITFAGLSNGGFLTTNGSGVLSTSTIGIADLTAEDFGSFSVSGGSATIDNNSITPDMASSTGQVDEYCLTYEATGDTWAWQDCSAGAINLTDLGDVDTTNSATGTLISYTGSSWATTSTSSLNINTDNLVEGSNLFFTNTRARDAISESITGLTYTSATGIWTLDGTYNIPLTASTTNWNNFYDTPSTVITDGTGLTWTGNTLALTNDFGASIDESELNINAPTDDYILVASTTATGGFEWVATSTARLGLGGGGGGAETNSLETTITGIADTEIFIGNGADSGTFAAISGDATMDNAGALTLAATNNNLTTLSNVTTVGALNAGSIAAGFGTIDNGTSNITTGGILKVDVDGTAINAAGSLTMGAGNDAAIYWNGTNFEIDTSAGIEFSISGTPEADLAADGFNIITGDSYQINNVSVLDATTLGSSVVNSSLTSLGTIGTGVWQGTAIANGYVDDDLTISASGTIDPQAITLATGNVLVGDGSNNAIATSSLYVDTNGNVGIGTTSPSSKLDVWGDFRVGTGSVPALFADVSTGNVGIGTSTGDADLEVQSNTSNTGAYVFQLDNAAGSRLFDIDDYGVGRIAQNFSVYSNDMGVERARMNNTGNFLAGNGLVGGAAFSFLDDGDTGMYSPSNGAVAFTNDSSESLRITSGGDVGIGTTSPSSKLDVWGGLTVGISSVPNFMVDTASGRVAIGTSTANTSADFTVRGDQDIIYQEIGSPYATISTDNNTLGMEVVGDYLYTAGGSFAIFDISDLENTGAITVGSEADNFMYDVAVSGNYAYVTLNSATDNFRVFDISDKTNPIIIGTYDFGDHGYSVDVSGNYAYVGHNASAGNEVNILDISDPTNVIKVGGFDPGGNVWEVMYRNGYLYVVSATTGDEFDVYDVTDPTNPVATGGVALSGNGAGLDISGNYAYAVASNGTDEFSVINIASSTPYTVSSLDLGLDTYNDVVVAGDYAFVGGDGTEEVTVINVSNPSSPVIIDTFVANNQVYDLTVAGNTLFVSSQGGNPGVEAFDLGGLKAPSAEIDHLYARAVQSGLLQADTALVQGGLNVGQNTQIGGALSIIGYTGTTTAFDTHTNPALQVLSGNIQFGTTSTISNNARLTVQSNGTNDILNLFETGGTEVFTVLESGNVGIGTTSPAHKLSVVGDIYASSTGTSTLTGKLLVEDSLYVQSDGTSGLFVTRGAAFDENLRIEVGDSNVELYSNQDESSGTNGGFEFHMDNDGDDSVFEVYSGSTELLTILGDSGNVGIGTTTPGSLFHVYDTAGGFTSGLRVDSGNEAANMYFDTGDADSDFLINYTGTGGSDIEISSTGEIRLPEIDASQGTYPVCWTSSDGEVTYTSNASGCNTGSDERLKENIVDTGSVLDSLLDVRFVDYNFIGESAATGTQTGVIAQELYEIFPDLVHVGGDDVDTDPWAVAYQGLGIKAAQGVQELHVSLEELLTYGTTTTGSTTLMLLQDGNEDTVWEKIVSLVSGFADGVLALVGLSVEEVNTDKLCVGDICVTEEEFAEVFGSNANSSSLDNSSSDNSSYNDSDSGSSSLSDNSSSSNSGGGVNNDSNTNSTSTVTTTDGIEISTSTLSEIEISSSTESDHSEDNGSTTSTEESQVNPSSDDVGTSETDNESEEVNQETQSDSSNDDSPAENSVAEETESSKPETPERSPEEESATEEENVDSESSDEEEDMESAPEPEVSETDPAV